MFQSEGIQVRLWNKPRTLRDALSRKPKQTCNRPRCKMKETGMCFRRGVVYKLTCPRCSLSYVGSTERELHDRVHEHLTKTSSSYHAHSVICCNSPPEIEVLACERDPKNLRLREAILIEKCKPAINMRHEADGMKSFINFWDVHLLMYAFVWYQFFFLSINFFKIFSSSVYSLKWIIITRIFLSPYT